MSRITLILVSLGALAACAEPNAPTVSRGDVDNAFAEAERVGALDVATGIEVPTGSVTYDGQIGADLSGDTLGSILGDMTMVVGFDSNLVDGVVDNINLIDQDGTPDQRFSGSLDISGRESNGTINAAALGDITAVDVNSNQVTAELFLDLDGDVRTDDNGQTAVYGSAVGDAQGEFNFDVDGVFYGLEQ